MAWLFIFCLTVSAQTPDWSENAWIPPEGRSNPYSLTPHDFALARAQGQIHAHRYPVETTGILIPEAPLKAILDNTTWNPLKSILNEVFKDVSGVDSYQGLFEWAGLVPPPDKKSLTFFQVALPDNYQEGDLYGYSRLQKNGVTVFTMSCAACHSDQLFGQTILGMSKRFPRANDFFIRAKKAAPLYSRWMVQLYTGATSEEMDLFDESLSHLESVGLKQPLALGLDTSLAQVALSLNHRQDDAWATPSSQFAEFPRPDLLDHQPGDSKPAVWWNTKYKTRWLSDGSVLSGNPIYTNILWNEIGRGSDLHKLDQWLATNATAIQELTTAVFSNEAPRFEQFFDAKSIAKESALRGEIVFQKTCMRCHGQYEKNWSLPEFQNKSWDEQIKTARVIYPQPTRVYDVGTDSYRRQSMKSLEKLNRLAISQRQGIQVLSQEGYVPPPLVGIWARWPYFHNNAIPNLCALLTPAQERPRTYFAGPAKDKRKDFDRECNGYPLGQQAPSQWQWLEDSYFDTQIPGLSNSGHDEGIFLENGKELLSAQNKKDLIAFLQTL